MSDDPYDDRIDQQGQQLREELDAARRRMGDVHRWRCSAELRARVVAHAVVCVHDGESHTRIAARLGLPQPTLSGWIRKTGATYAGFRQVAIVPSERRSARIEADPLRLVSPRGYVVEGLDAELLAALLRALG